MRLRTVLGLVAMLGLAACGNGLEKYTESPAVTTYFSSLIPPAAVKTDFLVSACSEGDDSQVVAVMFGGNMLYTYDVTISDKSVELESVSSRAQRHSSQGGFAEVKCIGYFEAALPPHFVPVGRYRLYAEEGKLQAYVLSSVLVDKEFDDREKLRLEGAAKALLDAIKRQSEYVPVEKSWGVNT